MNRMFSLQKVSTKFLIVSLFTLSSPVIHAATAQTTFQVTATVVGTCSISATALAFGSYNPSSPSLNAANTVSITCTNGTSYSVALNAGSGSGTVANRLMTGSSATLGYNIYTDNTYSVVWGDGSGTSVPKTGTGSGVVQNLTGYGQIATGQYQPAGNYTDTITATVTY